MPQPDPAEPRDSDPLLAFSEEHEKPFEPLVAATDPDQEDGLRPRLERVERQVERALIDITTVKSDLATLVSAIDDIKRRMGRVPAVAEGSGAAGSVRPATGKPIAPARKLGWLRTLSAFILRA